MSRIFLNPPAMSKLVLACALAAFVVVLPASAKVKPRAVYATKDKVYKADDKPRLGSFGSPTINDLGQIAVLVSLYGAGTSQFNSTGILSGNGGSPKLIARRGFYFVPEFFGTGNLTFPEPTITDLSDLAIINNKGDVAIAGTLRGYVMNDPEADASTEINGDILAVAGPNRALPTLVAYASNSQLVNFYARRPFLFEEVNKDFRIDSKGRAVFTGISTNFNVFGEFDGIWFGTPGVATSVLTLGEVVHGLPFGSNYESFGSVAIDSSQEVYTIATISGRGAGFFGIWAGKNGFLNPVVTRLTKKPQSTVRFTSFAPPISVSRSGATLAFQADGAIWTRRSKTLKEVAKPSSNVEGSAPSLRETIQTIQSAPAVNRFGQVAFLGTTRLAAETNTALIASTRSGRLMKIAKVGESLQVKGRTKEVINIELSPGGAINNLGQVTFTASFTDRTSAVFVAKVK